MQIPLELRLPVKATLDDFVADNQAEISAILADTIRSSAHQFVYLHGSHSTGKTHLLSAACQMADGAHKSVIYLPLKQAGDFSPEICEGLESADIICIDDINAIASQAEWETALFHLYNRIKDHNRVLLVTSDHPASDIPIELPDLKSRLTWGITLGLKELSDEDKQTVLQRRAEQMGMNLPGDSCNYLMNHHSRTLNALLETLETLERASLAAHRKLTIPFIREVLIQS